MKAKSADVQALLRSSLAAQAEPFGNAYHKNPDFTVHKNIVWKIHYQKSTTERIITLGFKNMTYKSVELVSAQFGVSPGANSETRSGRTRIKSKSAPVLLHDILGITAPEAHAAHEAQEAQEAQQAQEAAEVQVGQEAETNPPA
jgi:hypothetical protein